MRTPRDESGFSIIEIVFALFIMFFVLTAMLTTLGVATDLSSKARYTSVATALAEDQMEQVHSMDYVTIGMASPGSGEPTGTLQSQDTTIVDNMDFTIDRQVEWVDDPVDGTAGGGTDSEPNDYKRLTVVVSWESDVSQGSLSIATNFREDDEQGIKPTVEFTAVPPQGAILYNPGAPSAPTTGADAIVHSTGSVAYFQAHADDTSDPAGAIASLTFFIDSTAMIRNHYSTPDNICSFAPSGDPVDFTAPASPGFSIDTLAVDASGTAIYPDGVHEIRVETWDVTGLRDYRVQSITVDNYAPDPPSAIGATPTATDDGRYSSMDIEWTAAQDGGSPVPGYLVFRNPYNGYAGQYWLTANPSGTSVTTDTTHNDDVAAGAPEYPIGASRVWDFYVRALSAAGWASSDSYITNKACNGPGLAGTVFEPSSNNRDVKVIWGDRTWTLSGGVDYDIAYSRNTPTGGTPANMFTHPGADTTILVDVCKSEGSGTYNPATYATSAKSGTGWSTTFDTSDAANPHWVFESDVAWKKNDPNPYAYMQVRARMTGGYYTGTVYSNMIGPEGSGIGDYADNPYPYF